MGTGSAARPQLRQGCRDIVARRPCSVQPIFGVMDMDSRVQFWYNVSKIRRAGDRKNI